MLLVVILVVDVVAVSAVLVVLFAVVTAVVVIAVGAVVAAPFVVVVVVIIVVVVRIVSVLCIVVTWLPVPSFLLPGGVTGLPTPPVSTGAAAWGTAAASLPAGRGADRPGASVDAPKVGRAVVTQL